MYKNISKLASEIVVATMAEKEVERLLKVLLKGTMFANKTYAVGGYVRDEFLGIESQDLDVVVEIKDGAKKITHYIKDELGAKVSTCTNG